MRAVDIDTAAARRGYRKHAHREPAVNYDMALAAAGAYAEGRGGAVDPTESLPDEARDYVRAKTLEHIQRLERNRVARADAARYRSSRDYTGELVPSDPSGPEVVADLVPATWDEMRARRSTSPRPRLSPRKDSSDD